MRSQGIAQGTTPTLTGSVLPRAIVDNSVWQRTHLLDVKVALTELFQAGYEVVTCAPQLLEVLWSARSGTDHARIAATFGRFQTVDPQPGFARGCSRLQGNLWSHGMVRAVGGSDIQIAMTALQHDCTVVHYDQGFELIQRVEPTFSQRWIAARGSLPT